MGYMYMHTSDNVFKEVEDRCEWDVCVIIMGFYIRREKRNIKKCVFYNKF